jgi:hypothetical protein
VKETFDAALALFRQAQAESAAELAQSRVRVAKLEAIDALEKAGRTTEARKLLAEVTDEQKKLGMRPDSSAS